MDAREKDIGTAAFGNADMPQLPPSATRDRGARTARTSKTVVESSAAPSAGHRVPGLGALVALVHIFGQLCRMCGAHDESQDLIVPAEKMCWGYPPKPPRNQGLCCYYCMRVYEARFRSKMSLSELYARLGQANSPDAQLFKSMRDAGIEKMKQAGTRDIRIAWQAEGPGQQVFNNQEQLTILEEPDDPMMLWDDYVALHGEPAKNGKGHREVTIDGVRGVLLPQQGPRIYKVKRQRINRNVHRTTVQDGLTAVSQDQFSQAFADLNSASTLPRATGDVMNLLLGPPTGSASSESATALSVQSQPAPTLAAGPSTNKKDNDVDDIAPLRFGFVEDTTQKDAVAAAPEATAAEATPQKRLAAPALQAANRAHKMLPDQSQCNPGQGKSSTVALDTMLHPRHTPLSTSSRSLRKRRPCSSKM